MSNNKVAIEVIFISSRGFVEPFETGQVFDADKLALIQPSSDDFVNAEEFLKSFKPSVKIQIADFDGIQAVSLISKDTEKQDAFNNAFDDRSHLSSVSYITNSPTIAATEDELPIIRERQIRSPSMLRRLPYLIDGTCASDAISLNSGGTSYSEDASCHSVKLGLLPDNRAVFWFACDQKALYVSSTNLESSASKTVNPFVCVWGCTEVLYDSQHVLSFQRKEDFKNHMVIDHSYSSWVHDRMFSSTGALLRVPEGNPIQLLQCDIAATACLIDPEMKTFTRTLPQSCKKYWAGKVYYKSSQENFLIFDEEHHSESTAVDKGNHYSKNSKAIDLFLLSMRIRRLFDIDGHYKNQDKGQIVPCAQDALSQTCYQRTPDFCSSCNLRSEHVMRCGNNDARARGLGCSTLTKQCFGLESDPQGGKSFANQLLFAKRILLTLVAKVPKCVTANESSYQFSGQLWKGKLLDKWVKLVKESRSFEALNQAYAILVGSVDHYKMPNWWQNEGEGWRSVQSAMSIQSISALLMHLIVLDGAVTEYLSQLISDVSSLPKVDLPSAYKGLTYQQISARVLQVANRVGVTTFDGENGEYCCVCWEGGELLCCEFCANVQHADCTIPTITPFSCPEKFVCNPCIADIAYLQKNGA